MTFEARQKAERCFALARSTTFDGERANAIEKGLAICTREKLDPDTFDIPGRPRTKAAPPPQSAYREDIFQRARSPFWHGPTSYEVEEMMRQFRAQMEAQAAAQAAERQAAERKREAAYREGVAENERRVREQQAKRADAAANALFAMGIKVYQAPDAADGSRRWHVVGPEVALGEFSDEALINLQRRETQNRTLKEAADRAGFEVPVGEVRIDGLKVGDIRKFSFTDARRRHDI